MKHYSLASALVLAASGLFTTTASIYAASLSFTPAGAQLDGDPIKDIAESVGAAIAFNIRLDTTGLAPVGGGSFPAGSTLTIGFIPSWDTNELTKTTQKLAPGGSPFGNPVANAQNGNNGQEIIYRGINLGTTGLLSSFTFSIPGLNNNGNADFSIRLRTADVLNAAGGGGVYVGPQFNPTAQDVEVQPIPEPLTLLGAGTALGFGTFFKRKLNHSKSTKKETTKVG